MNVVFIVPTGIGAEIGGHAGDATPCAKLIASVCDVLLVHPNVVNASDVNEMTENMWYVEGSNLDCFLEGSTGLRQTSQNKILLAVNGPVPNSTINAVSAARSVLGADIEVLELNPKLGMRGFIKDGLATGEIENLHTVFEQVENHSFDVLVMQTPIDVDRTLAESYLTSTGGVNIWGGVEALLSRTLSEMLNKPVIHAPVENSLSGRGFDPVVDPRKAAEMVSVCYLHCCLKGAHVAPKMSDSNAAMRNTDIDFLVSPIGVTGRPHRACLQNDIPIIYVEENKTVLNDDGMPGSIVASNYLEAAGVICARRARVSLESVRRPLKHTFVL